MNAKTEKEPSTTQKTLTMIRLAMGDWSRHKARIYKTGDFDDLSDLAKWITELPPIQVKRAEYFLRGDATYRSNDTMKSIELLVIDGDSSSAGFGTMLGRRHWTT